ncbi:hypothetical protein FALCPG4_015397 [Fusarium falciforme]
MASRFTAQKIAGVISEPAVKGAVGGITNKILSSVKQSPAAASPVKTSQEAQSSESTEQTKHNDENDET